MPAPKGNQFWKARSKHGRDKIFKTPDALWNAACEYFEWIEANPLMEAKMCSYQGVNIIEEMPKMRAMTISGFCLFIGCNEDYLRKFTDNENKDFSPIINAIEKTIFNQKFAGAAADLLNPNIIARELGLFENQNINVTTIDLIEPGDPIKG